MYDCLVTVKKDKWSIQTATALLNMIIESIALGTITLTYKPPQPPPLEVGRPIVEIAQIEPLSQLEMAAVAPIAPKPVKAPEPTESKSVAVPSGPNTYEPGQCTWHTKNMRPSLPNTLGNATTWLARAKAMGMSTGSLPQQGAVAWKIGHVAFVLDTRPGEVLISEMNYNYVPFSQRQIWKPASAYTYIY